MKKGICCFLLAIILTVFWLPLSVSADDNTCVHHREHTAECGYREAAAGIPCRHKHDKDCLACVHTAHDTTCGYVKQQKAVPCRHTHSELCSVCDHKHDESCGYERPPVSDYRDEDGERPDSLIVVTVCRHKCTASCFTSGKRCNHKRHDQNCGYQQAVEGKPCLHEHDEDCYGKCPHKHDEACGYKPEVKASDCQYLCPVCDGAKAEDHTHIWGFRWQNDMTHHWRGCTAPDCDLINPMRMDAYAPHSEDENGICSVCSYFIDPTKLQFYLTLSPITEGTQALNAVGLDTPEKIAAKLTEIMTVGAGYDKEKTETYAMKLQYSTDGGVSRFDVEEHHFPIEGLNLLLPYPNGTSGETQDFFVTHIFDDSSQKLGTVAGNTEQPFVTEMPDGIAVTLKGVSPFGIAWKNASAKPQNNQPREENILLIVILILVCGIGVAASMIIGSQYVKRRKRR